MCTIFAQKSTSKCKKQMEKPSALFVTLHFALFVVLTVMRCGTIVAVCYCDGCKLAVVVFAVMATSAHVTTDCLLVLHSSTSFFKLSVHNYTAKNTPFLFLFGLQDIMRNFTRPLTLGEVAVARLTERAL